MVQNDTGGTLSLALSTWQQSCACSSVLPDTPPGRLTRQGTGTPVNLTQPAVKLNTLSISSSTTHTLLVITQTFRRTLSRCQTCSTLLRATAYCSPITTHH